jgi:hypothetical protein
MAGESTVVQVDITVQDAVPRAPDFGTVLVVADTDNAWLGVRSFTPDTDGLNSLVDDFGVDIDNGAYKLLSAFASGTPAVATVKIYSRTLVNVQTVDLTPTITTEGHIYTISINGVEVTYQVPAAATVNTICDALETLINVIDGVVATPDNATATKLTLTRDTGFPRFGISGVSKGFTILDVSADAGVATDLAAAILEDDEFSFIVLDSNSKAEILAANTFAAANKKIQLAHTIDTGVLTNATTDTAGSLVTLSSNNTWLLHSLDTQTLGIYSYVSSFLTYHPATANPHMWSVGSGEARRMNPTERGFAQSKRVTVLTSMAGVNVLYGNRLPSGRAVPTQQFLYYLERIMQLDVLALFIAQPKIAFTPTGITQVEEVMKKRLALEEQAGALLEGSGSVTPKLYADTTLIERGNGLLDAMKFSAVIAVSIDKVIIKGSLTI